MISAEYLFVAHGSLCRQIQDVIVIVRADDNLQPAKERAAATAFHAKIIPAHGSAPATVVDNCFELKTREIIRHLAQAFFNVLGQFESPLRVTATAFLLT